MQGTGGIYSLGAVGEVRLGFDVGQNPIFFVIDAGHIRREATEDVPDPADVRFHLPLGARTQ